MKKGLILSLGIFVGMGAVQSASAQDILDRKGDLLKEKGQEKALRRNDLNIIVLPAPLKVVAPRKIDLSAINSVVERTIDRKTLEKELKAKGAKRHFSTRSKKKALPSRGPVVGKSLVRDKAYYPPKVNLGTSYIGTLGKRK